MRLLNTLLFFLVPLLAFAQGRTLSEKAQISIITCAPGQEQLYSAFGHSAIRVYDPDLRVDHAFNYGVFDFDQPNFYLNFARGSSFYKLAVMYYPDFLYTYQYYNRSVTEQILNLTADQKQTIFNFLIWNAQPENASYRYDYFYDNCATRVRDVFANQLKGVVTFDSTYIQTDYTIRDLTDLYLTYQPWGDLGIDICLGLPMDKKASPYEYMFLPDYIQSSFNHAHNDATNSALVKSEQVVFRADPMSLSNGLFHPWVVFGIFLLVIVLLTYRDFKRNQISFWLDGLLLLGTGLIGILLLLLWTSTDHQAAAKNFNLLWALPTNLVALYFILSKKLKPLSKYYRITFAVNISVLLSWPFLPQALNIFLVPFVLALAIRYGVNYMLLGKS
ncbi:MAG: DUF4105 domain-containing protein [Cyclobacteriaceae bacterium]